MKTIDITNQVAPYTFAGAKFTPADIAQTKRILKKIHAYLSEYLTLGTIPTSVSFLSKNRRMCRIIIYDFEKLLSEKNIFVVIFYGNKRQNVSKELNKDFFSTDWEIAMSMSDDDNILTYASQELGDGNWFNIVLFTKKSATHDVTVKEKHQYAAYVLAPKRFSWVRLHNALLPNGIEKFTEINLTNTKYYEFDTMWFATRKY